MDDPRGERLQIMLTKEELEALDTWRFERRMPSRAAAVRELLRRGLSAEGFAIAAGAQKSGDFGVISEPGGNSENPVTPLRGAKAQG
jgi:metal-responsive CopG/Arc/MetJ family transcriptional regulator